MRVVAYLRVSTDKQDPENQKYGVTQYCQRRGLQEPEFVIETITGKSKHSKVDDIIEELDKGDILIVPEITRMARNLLRIMVLLNQALEKGISIYTIKEDWVLKDDMQSKTLAFAFGISAEIERNMISMRTKEGLERKRSEGVILGRRKGRKNDVYKLDKYKKEIRQDLRNGVTRKEMCDRYGCSKPTIINYIKKLQQKNEKDIR